VNLPGGIRGRLVAIGLLVLPLVLVGEYVLRPLLSAYMSYHDDIAALHDEIARYRGVIAELPALRASIERLDRTQPLRPYLLGGGNPALAAAALQRQLRSLADEHDATLVSVRVEPAVPEGDLERIRVRARLQTSSRGLRDTLHALESSRPYLFVEQLSASTRERRRRERATDSVIDVQMVVSGLRAPVTRSDPGAANG
jgi:general secretion pathway protein M